MYAVAQSAVPIVGTRIHSSLRGSSTTPTPTRAGPIPSASDGQKRAP
jgi:hypothetical protein